MKDLTVRQKEVLDYISRFQEENRYPPAVRDVARAFRFSVKGAYDHIKAIERKGFLQTDQNRSRSIRLVEGERQDQSQWEEFLDIPILGRVAAGLPLLAEENLDGYLKLPRKDFRSGQYFALRVAGTSMVGVGIMDGDLAIIRQQPVAENGQIIVALTDEAVTLKRFYKEGHRFRLQPENPDMNPIYTQDLKVLGRLVSIIRHYD